MPVTLNTGANATYGVNASRIEKFMNAQNRDQALYMGPVDKFKDLFRATDNKKSTQIARIYDAITQPAAGQAAPLDRLGRFHQLKNMAATPEDRNQFSVTFQAPQAAPGSADERWGYTFSIGNDRIVEETNLQNTPEQSAETFRVSNKALELAGRLNTLPAYFNEKDSQRDFDRYIFDQSDFMTLNKNGQDHNRRAVLRENWDNPIFSKQNFVGLEAADDPEEFKAVFKSGDTNHALLFRNQPTDVYNKPCGDTLKSWLQDDTLQYGSLRELMAQKFQSPEDHSSLRHMPEAASKVVKDVLIASGENYTELEIATGAAQKKFGQELKSLAEQKPELVAATLSQISNVRIGGKYENSDIVLKSFFEPDFYQQNQQFFTDMKNLAAQRANAAASNQAGVEQQPVADQGFYDAVLGNDSEQPPGASNNRTGVRNDGMIIIHP